MSAKLVDVDLGVPQGISEEIRQKALGRAIEAAVLTLWEAAALSTREAAAELDLAYPEFLALLAAKGLSVDRDFDPDAVERAKGAVATGRS